MIFKKKKSEGLSSSISEFYNRESESYEKKPLISTSGPIVGYTERSPKNNRNTEGEKKM